MSNFRIIAALDVFELVASLRSRMHLFKPEGEARVLHVRRPVDPDADPLVWRVATEWRKWPELKNTVARIHRLAEALLSPLERGRIFVEMVDPGLTQAWRLDEGSYAERFLRVVLPLRSGPGVMMFAGIDSLSPAVGTLTLVNGRTRHCIANVGEWPHIHLSVDFTKAAPGRQGAANRE